MLRRGGAAVLAVAAILVGAALLTSSALAVTRPPGVRGRIVGLAASQLGYRDHGDYCTRYGPCEYWCSLFATWAWRRAGVAIPSLAFTGDMYTWAKLETYVLHRPQQPKPGDVALFGTGPSTVSSSRHVGVVEAVFPGYLVTIEGDVYHAVRRFVVPIADPQRIGEPGPIYAYASPVAAPRGPLPSLKRFRPLSGARLRRAVAAQDQEDKLSPEDRRLHRTIRALRAFQHMPYRTPDTTIDWVDVDRRGRIDVQVTSDLPLADAQQDWRDFLARYHDSGGAYVVHYSVPADVPASPPPSSDVPVVPVG